MSLLFHIKIELCVFLAISTILYFELQHVKSLDKEIKKEKSKTARFAGELLAVILEQLSLWGLLHQRMKLPYF